jgi:protein-disulfide isomerase
LVGQEDEMGLLMAKVAEVARQTDHYPAVHRLLFTETEAADSSALMLLAIAGGIPEKDLSIRLNSRETLRKIEADYNEAKRLEIAGTPSYVLNGKLYVGLMNYTDIDSL